MNEKRTADTQTETSRPTPVRRETRRAVGTCLVTAFVCLFFPILAKSWKDLPVMLLVGLVGGLVPAFLVTLFQRLGDKKSPPDSEQIWHSDKCLIVPHAAELPKRCVKTNEPASATVKVKQMPVWGVVTSGTEAGWGIFFFPLLVLLCIANVLVEPRVALRIPVSVGTLNKAIHMRRTGLLIVAGGLLAGTLSIAIMSSGVIPKATSPDAVPGPAVIGVALLCACGFVAAVYGVIRWCKGRSLGLGIPRITKTHYWLSGIDNPDYLDTFPVWQGAAAKSIVRCVTEETRN